MNPWTGLGATVALALCLVCPRPASAQLHPALPQRYLLTTDAFDGRAVWVNPAGLARRIEASLGTDATLERSSGSTRVSQFGATIRSRNLAFAWMHDRYPGHGGANNFALGVGLGDETLSLGATRRWYGGPGGNHAWDLAVRGRPSPLLDLSLVWRNTGSPTVRDTVYGASVIPAAAFHFLQGRLVAGAEGDLSTDLRAFREIRAGATWVVAAGVAVSLRGEFSPGFAKRGFAVAVTLSRARSRSTLVALLPSGANSIQTLGASTAVVATEPAPTRRR